ncbi:MAG TPA: tetraacyldisaccharide 4'-kinase, partial [Terriglobia bacterium]|nr:tetraacyldisaccharide 4'-kinase [Terriglobia bacterium]
RTPGVAVVVGADRFEAGRLAEREDLGDLFILDDGFQHRGLYRNVDLLTIDPEEWAAGEKLLPTGRWREPKSAIQRAQAACIQEKRGATIPQLPIPAFRIQTVIDGIYRGCDPVDLDTLRGHKIVAFAGIAKPGRFFEALESLGVPIARRIEFRDHHSFTPEEIEKISNKETNAILVTTEKDSVRLEGMGLGNFLHLRISANISEFDRLMILIRSRLS